MLTGAFWLLVKVWTVTVVEGSEGWYTLVSLQRVRWVSVDCAEVNLLLLPCRGAPLFSGSPLIFISAAG